MSGISKSFGNCAKKFFGYLRVSDDKVKLAKENSLAGFFCEKSDAPKATDDALKSRARAEISTSANCCSRRAFFLKFAGLFGAIFVTTTNVQALVIKHTEYTPLSQLARKFGMTLRTIEASKTQRISNKSTSLTFEVHKKEMLLGGVKVWLGFPVVEYKGMLYVANSDIENTLQPILFPKASKYTPRLRTIVIDAGHGGKDKGAISKAYGLFEKDLTLDISLRLAKILRLKGYKVYLTRSSDKFLELQDRPAYANKLKGDLFLSIHINAAGSSAAGTETYTITPVGQNSTNASAKSAPDKRSFSGNSYGDWNTLLSYYIQKELSSTLDSEDRGSKRARFVVLQDIKMPAALVECGFISNPSEGRLLARSDYRQKVAQAISLGIARYASTLVRLRRK